MFAQPRAVRDTFAKGQWGERWALRTEENSYRKGKKGGIQ